MPKIETTADIWNYFENRDHVNKYATCKFCKGLFSYKSTTANLKIHLKKMHMEVYETFCPTESSISYTDCDTDNVEPKIVHVDHDIGSSGEEEEAYNDEDDSVLLMKKRTRPGTSSIWKHFESKDHVEKKAMCKYCNHFFSYKSTITNLKLHLEKKHTEVYETLCPTGSSISYTDCDTDNVKPKIVYVDHDIGSSGEEEETYNNEDDSVLLMKKRTRAGHSSVWKYFEKKDHVEKKAMCKYCNNFFSYKSTITNLKLHLEKKHTEVYKEFCGTRLSANFIVDDTCNVEPEIVLPISNDVEEEMDVSGDDSVLVVKLPKKRASDVIWNYFEDSDHENRKAMCKYCENLLSYKSTITNLKLHLQKKHIWAYAEFCKREFFSGSIVGDTGDAEPKNIVPISSTDLEKINSFGDDSSLFVKMPKKMSTDTVWNYFENRDHVNKKAMCKYCENLFSYKSTITNLKLHLQKKHLEVYEEYCRRKSISSNVGDPGIVKSEIVLSIGSDDQEDMDISGYDRKSLVKMPKKGTTDDIWNYFEDRDHVKKIAMCNYCENLFSYKSTITNLKLHLQKKHTEVFKEFCRMRSSTSSIISDTGNIKPEIAHVDIPIGGGEEWLDSDGDDGVLLVPDSATRLDNQSAPLASYFVIPKLSEHLAQTFPTADIQTQPSKKHQKIISSYTPKKLKLCEKAHVDKCLLNLIINDFQPFRILENEEFKEYMCALKPNYVLPQKKTLTDKLTAEYETALQSTKELVNYFCKSICLTADYWISRNLVAYIAITGHFIHCETLEHHSVLLRCSALESHHTSAHIAKEIKKIIEEWGIKEKVNFFVAGSAPNLLSAANLLGWEHFGCYSHKLNLIVQAALNVPSISTTLQKVQEIIAHFKGSSQAKENLIQNQINIQNVTPGCTKNLILHIPSQWVSTFLMLQRFSEIQEALRFTIPNLTADLPMIPMEEWKCIEQLVEVLEPFYDLTVIMNAEKYLVASKALVLTQGLQDIFERHLQRTDVYDSVKEVIICLKNELNNQFDKLEFNEAIGLCTYLDPRFKEHAFDNQDARAGIKLVLIDKIVAFLSNDDCIVARENTIQDKKSIWKNFDSKIKLEKTSKSSSTIAEEEIEMYLKEAVINRTACPLQWWRDHKDIYPSLYSLFIHHSNIVVTSVPCEREFSKAGYTLSDRRTQLSSSKVTQIMFLNANYTT